MTPYEAAEQEWIRVKATETDPQRLAAARETFSKARSQHRQRYTPPNRPGDATAHPEPIVIRWR